MVLVTAGSPLTDAQKTQLATLPKALAGIQGVSGQPSPPIVSQDGTAAQLFVPVKASAAVADTVAAMRSALPGLVPSGTTAYVTGPAGFTGDLVASLRERPPGRITEPSASTASRPSTQRRVVPYRAERGPALSSARLPPSRQESWEAGSGG